ncbi:diphosphomevalonate decarboxylase [Thermaurantimonas aggregans]|uniref:diphosphomevalonate decarboxylase n=1 Tax=Thermaurantimonas aggregans TaxID=2173829 RepID=A0A401XN59_9FLAO|nr:diphosphomevalonate decarboxylase [Thermaurantimonas aggregans]GCD78422.1 diphosphomevalonate decarboxylase [Thermaurantimonas aggregans]
MYTTRWIAPSNIAIVKYWGKFDHQIPANPSLSFTLTHSHTDTKLTVIESKTTQNDDPTLEVFYDGISKPEFQPKILKFLQAILNEYPWLKGKLLKIETKNTFPHSSGIASSASGMAALACCIEDLHATYFVGQPFRWHKASESARLGSGSACRSVYGGFVQWGHSSDGEGSDFFATPVQEVHPNFKTIYDYILILDSGEKSVSSTVGHSLMKNHPYASHRFKQGKENTVKLKAILKTGDWRRFIELMESEALTLHAMMMTSTPPFILMKPKTLEAIQKIWQFRQTTNLPIGFTLDAGANLHLIFTADALEAVEQKLLPEVQYLCEQNTIIKDLIGRGPFKAD